MQGKAFDPVYFGAWFADAIEAAGLPDECVLHGLRKTAARLLAEAGCSKEEIKAITGHTTSRPQRVGRSSDERSNGRSSLLSLQVEGY
jgi:integrase